MQRKNNFVFIGIILVIMIFAMIALTRGASTAKKYVYSDIYDLFANEQVDSFVLTDNQLTLTLKAPDADGNETETYSIVDYSVFYNDFNDIVTEQYASGILKSYDLPATPSTPWWFMFIPYLVIAIVLLGIWTFLASRANGGGQERNAMKFARARATTEIKEEDRVTFADVAGADEEKAELQEIVDFLKNPDKYTRLGAKIPKGILLVGPPGTGKTLLAKAVAGEAKVQFLSISGSDFVELYVGVGASRVRDLFDQAKKQSPAIIFIDEIDAVGRQRGAGLGGGHDEREQTLNQLLVEMDGFTNNAGVIVMAATNRVDILDHALLRPGRFDRQIYVGAPDAKGRAEVLRVHSRNKPLAEDVDLEVIAKETTGFTGADLQNLMNEAALRAAKLSRPVIVMEDIQESMIKVIAGPEKKSRVVNEREKRLTAYHEAGHAIAMHLLPTHDKVHQITIVPRGMAGGMTISLPAEDHNYMTRNEMLEQIVALLGGRVAEDLVLGDISTGASNDLQRATHLARSMVTKYGMSTELGTVVYDADEQVFIGRSYGQTRNYSESYASRIDDEVQTIMNGCYKQCKDLIESHAEQLHTTAAYLMENETMSAEDFVKVMDGSNELPENSDIAELPTVDSETEVNE